MIHQYLDSTPKDIQLKIYIYEGTIHKIFKKLKYYYINKNE